ncbi:hypothetical protein ACJMK2_027608 [Sinanodonta woodiana]|uniref:G-protein coupled receptors family 1 profile domain-containing protein n=1 Tax=Sinanodonta woodiana TaxID=1069815 RepID=A0ABD3X4Q5_SINWO
MFASVSLSEEGTMLQKRSNELAIVFIPAIIFVSVLMILGLFGNSMVLYFYGFKTKKTPNICFILVLAVFDLLTCTLGMPMEIVDLVLNITFYNAAACKILRFVTFFTNIASALILASIAVDRYRRICKPHTNQLSIKQVKIICGLCASASVLLSWPASILYVTEAVPVIYTDPRNTTHQANITGFDCTLTSSHRYAPYILTFHVVHFILFVALTISLAVMYGLIARRLCNSKTTRLDFAAFNQKGSGSDESPPEQSDTSSVAAAVSSPGTDSLICRDNSNSNDIEQPVKKIEELDDNVMDDKVKVNDDIVPVFIIRSNEKCNPSSNGTSSLHDLPNLKAIPRENKMTSEINTHESQSIRFTNGRRDNGVVKHTVMLFIVALVFVLSFLPYLGVAINGLFLDGYYVNIFTDGQLVGLELGSRSYFINGAFNPLIYGFFNSQFRSFVHRKLCPCHFWTRGDGAK